MRARKRAALFACKRVVRLLVYWSSVVRWRQSLVTLLERASSRRALRSKICAMMHWRHSHKHANAIQRCMQVCRSTSSSQALLRWCMLIWIDAGENSMEEIVYHRLIRVVQKRTLAKALLNWREASCSLDSSFSRSGQNIVVEAVRKHMLRLATKCFWSWVAFLHFRQKTAQSFFVVNGVQDRSLLGRSFLLWSSYREHGNRIQTVEDQIRNSRFAISRIWRHIFKTFELWVKHIRRRRRDVNVLHSIIHRARRMSVQDSVFAWKRVVDAQKDLLRREEIFIQRQAVVKFARFVHKWRKAHLRSHRLASNAKKTVKCILRRISLAVFRSWWEVSFSSKRLDMIVEVLLVRRKRNLQVAMLHAWQDIIEIPAKICAATAMSPSSLHHQSSPDQTKLQEKERKLQEQEEQIVALERQLQHERKEGELQMQKMVLELEQALEHATRARSRTPPKASSGVRGASRSTPTRSVGPSISPLIGASPLQTHVLSMISGSSDSLFATPQSPSSPAKTQKIRWVHLKRTFNAWKIMSLSLRQRRLLVVQAIMCRRRAGEQIVLNHVFAMWLIILRQALKVSNAADALNFQCRRMMMVHCFYAWLLLRSDAKAHGLSSSDSKMKGDLEWKVLPSPQKVSPLPQQSLNSSEAVQVHVLELQQCREQIATLDLQLKEERESGTRTTILMQEKLSAMQDEVQALLSQLDEMKHRSALCICSNTDATSQSARSPEGSVPSSERSSILPANTRTIALTLWSWRSGIDYWKMMNAQATIAGTRKWKLIRKQSFAKWLERVWRTTRILSAGKAMHRRRRFSLTRKCLLQMVQHVRNNLRLRLVHTPVGAMLEYATKESREQHFIKHERRVNAQFERSLYIWSVAVWKGFVRVSQKHRHEREAASRKYLHSLFRSLKQKFRAWKTLSTFKRSLVQRMKMRIQRQFWRLARSSFEAWVVVAQSLKRVTFKEASVLRSRRLHLIRRVFTFFVLHTEILNSMRCTLLRMLFHQSCKRLSTAYHAWMSMTAVQKMSNMRSALLTSRRKLRFKMQGFCALHSRAEMKKSAREGAKNAANASLKCCTRKRATRTMKAWASYVNHRRLHVMDQSIHLSSVISQRTSEPKVSSYFSVWREIGKQKQIQLHSQQSRARRRKLHHAFFALHDVKHRRSQLECLLRICCRQIRFKVARVFDAFRSRCAAKRWQKHLKKMFQRRSEQRIHFKVAHLFKEWRQALRKGLMIRKYSFRSQTSFEQRLFVRCARYWFASHIHQKSNRERLSCLLVSAEQDCASRVLREWSIATQRQRRVRSLIDMKRFYPVALASAGIFWWRQVCVRERTRRTFNGLFASFHRRYSLQGALALWFCVASCERSETSARHLIIGNCLKFEARTKEIAFRSWKIVSTTQRLKQQKILRVAHRAQMVLKLHVLTRWTLTQRSRSTVRAQIARLKAKKSRCLLRMVFEFLLPSQPCASLVRLPRFGYQRLNKLSLFLAWSCWTIEQIEAVKIQRHNRNQAYRHATHSLSSHMFRKWSMLTADMYGTMLKLRRFVCKWIRFRLCFYLSRWWDVVGFRKRLLARAAKRNQFFEKSRAWTAWLNSIENHQKLCRMLGTAVARKRHCVRNASFITWKASVKTRVRQRSTLEAMCVRKTVGVIHKALLMWGRLTVLHRRQCKLLKNLLRKLQGALVHRAWIWWAASALKTHRHRMITLKMATRMKNARLHQVWLTWKNVSNELRQRQRAKKKLARKVQLANLSKALVAWTPLCSRLSGSDCKIRHIMRYSDRSCMRRQFRHWALKLIHSKTAPGSHEKAQQAIDHLRSLVIFMQGRRRLRAVFIGWLALLETSMGLLHTAKAVSTKSRVHLASKYFNRWMSTRVHNQQQKTRISQESMMVQIRCLSNRRLEHLVARTLRLNLREHFCAWQEVNALLRAASARHRCAMLGSIGQIFPEWKRFVNRRSLVLRNMAHLACALLAVRQQRNSIWLEAWARGHRALDLVVMRVNSIQKKAVFDHWHFKCLLATATPGALGRERSRRKRAAFVRWSTYTSYCKTMGRKLTQFTRRRDNCRIFGCFASWTLVKMLGRWRTRVELFRRRKLLSAVMRGWCRCLDMLRRKLFCQRVCTARAEHGQTKLLVKLLQIWQQKVQLGRFEDRVSSQFIENQQKIKQLQHLSCAQLYMSTVQACEMMRGRQHSTLRALAEYVHQKRMHRRTRRVMLISTAVRRQGRLKHKTWRAWFQHVVNARLQTIEKHMHTYLRLAATADLQRQSQEQGLEETISSLGVKFATWETELWDTQALLHATCETFLDAYDPAASPAVMESSLSPNKPESWMVNSATDSQGQGNLGWSVEDAALAQHQQALDAELSPFEIYGEEPFPLQILSEHRSTSPWTSTNANPQE